MLSMAKLCNFNFGVFTKVVLSSTALCFAVTGCTSVDAGSVEASSSQYSTKASDKAQMVEVMRDGRLIAGSSVEQDECPTVFYINNQNVGRFTTHQQATFYLDPDSYTFMASNCNGRGNSYGLDIEQDLSSAVRYIVLSLDGHGRPVVIEKIERTRRAY